MYQLIQTATGTVIETATTEVGALSALDLFPSDVVDDAETWQDVIDACEGAADGIGHAVEGYALRRVTAIDVTEDLCVGGATEDYTLSEDDLASLAGLVEHAAAGPEELATLRAAEDFADVCAAVGERRGGPGGRFWAFDVARDGCRQSMIYVRPHKERAAPDQVAVELGAEARDAEDDGREDCR